LGASNPDRGLITPIKASGRGQSEETLGGLRGEKKKPSAN